MRNRETNQNRIRSRARRHCVYVLWGEGFDEVLAVTFVTALRKAGFQVKVVGLRLQPMAGAVGVTLVPEIGLDEALAGVERVCCIVAPCDEVGWQRLRLEPRVGQLLTAIPVLAYLKDIVTPTGVLPDGTLSALEERINILLQQIDDISQSGSATTTDTNRKA
ncbi:MAG: hypothetical protein R3C14_39800 [Caldilineaceae bacterium]